MIDSSLAHKLIASQFPQWKDLSIQPLSEGHDNRTFRLGKELLIRMPSAKEYAAQVEKEQLWLPKLAPFLPLPIPTPMGLGKPEFGYPWNWSIYSWLEGETATTAPLPDLNRFASGLADFLRALQRIDSFGGPLPGPHSFYRGGSLEIYDAETRQALALLKDQVDTDACLKIWEIALSTNCSSHVWVHGDISPGNLLVQEGQLSAVIDFGQLTVGDPACDLAIAWTFFNDESRELFRKILPLDPGTWARGRAWALWKALIVAAGLVTSSTSNISKARETLRSLLFKD